MKQSAKSGEEGFILVFTLLLMVVLVLLGVSAIDTSVFESTMSANDALYKRAFYQADGGTEAGIRLVYENTICTDTKNGFTGNYGPGNAFALIGNTVVAEDLVFSSATVSTTPSNTNRDIAFYPDANLVVGGPAHTTLDSGAHTNMLFRKRNITSHGDPLAMVSGYESDVSSKNAVNREYTIASQHQGLRNSESLITIRWRIGIDDISKASSFDCRY